MIKFYIQELLLVVLLILTVRESPSNIVCSIHFSITCAFPRYGVSLSGCMEHRMFGI